MVRALAALEKGALQLTPQPASGVTYANKIGKDETHIDWTGRGTRSMTIAAACRPFPARGSELPGAGRVKVLRTTKGPATVRRAACSTTD